MNKAPAFQFYANDWLSSTTIALMTAEQERGYLHLLLHEWNSPDCSLPDDDDVLARLSMMNEGWFNGGSELVRRCFIQHPKKPGSIINKKLFSVWEIQRVWRLKSADGGKKSGLSRKQSGCQKGLPKKRRVVAKWLPDGSNQNDITSHLEAKDGDKKTEQDGCRKELAEKRTTPASSVFSLQSSVSGLRTSSKNPLKPPRGHERTADIEVPVILQTDGFKAAWSDWLAYRSENHWKIGPTGLKNTLAKLAGMGAERATAALCYSMAQGWQGIFEEKEREHGKPKHTIGPGQVHPDDAASRSRTGTF